MNIEPRTLWAFVITVGFAVLAAGWTARVRPEPRPTLPLAHVAWTPTPPEPEAGR